MIKVREKEWNVYDVEKKSGEIPSSVFTVDKK